MSDELLDVPAEGLSEQALTGLIDEFITRDSTVTDGTLEQKRERVLRALKSGRAVVTFNTKDGTTHILTQDEFSKLSRSK